MPPRLRICSQCLSNGAQVQLVVGIRPSALAVRRASAQAITPAPSDEQILYTVHPISTTPPTQPSSHRRPEIRRTQLHRQYTSLLRSSPLLLLFQHNNLLATEWAALRRELAVSLRAVDEQLEPADRISEAIKLQIIRTGVFGAALRVVEKWGPASALNGPQQQEIHPTDPKTHSSLPTYVGGAKNSTRSGANSAQVSPLYTHAASREAYLASRKRPPPPLQPLLLGPVAVLSFPAISTAHLKAALRLLAPKAPVFAAPTRRDRPGYWEPPTQAAVRKLMLLGARVEGKVFDMDGTRWVGGIEGGLDGLRGQLVAMLQSVGGSLASTLESAGNSVYFTMEARRLDLEKGDDGESKDAEQETKSE